MSELPLWAHRLRERAQVLESECEAIGLAEERKSMLGNDAARLNEAAAVLERRDG